MYIGDLIGLQEALTILRVSRPTFDKIRKEYQLKEFKVGRFTKFSKTELLQRVVVKRFPLGEKFQFCFGYPFNFESLKLDENSYDLRKIDLMDGHAAISFICHIVSRVKNDHSYIHLIIDDSASWLKFFNFFGALKQLHNSKVFWDDDYLSKIPAVNFSEWIKLPVTRLGFVGAQTKIADDLTIQLAKQGYSDEVCSYIGWAMGELCDNASTHAGVHPCFVQFTQLGKDKKFLLFTIGDVGIGIPRSLRKNVRYSLFSDKEAILSSFKPYVSGRADEERRGKGLTDVLKITMECSSYLHVESNDCSFAFRFNVGKDTFLEQAPVVRGEGTVISVLFIDGNFASFDRDAVRDYIDSCLEKI
jgi:hypothetical protein